MPELDGRMGKAYSQVVAYCLGRNRSDNSVAVDGEGTEEYLLETRLCLEEFETQVVRKLETPIMV